jgi:hypothetical protein
MEVRTLDGLPLGVLTADPVVVAASRIHLLHQRVMVDAAPEAGDPHTTDLRPRPAGEVDVQQVTAWQSFCEQAPDESGDEPRGLGEVRHRSGREGGGDRWCPLQGALDGRGHRARVEHVLAHVGTEVDAGDDQVGSLIEQAVERGDDTVGRRAIHAVDVGLVLLDAEGAVERERVRGGALVTIRGNDDHAPQRSQRLLEVAQRGRLDAVVVREQDVHETLPVPVARAEWTSPVPTRRAARMAAGGTTPSPVRRSSVPRMRGTSRKAWTWLRSAP